MRQVADMPNGPNENTDNILTAVKAVGDWELDILAIPFGSKDSDGQWFDENTDIMPGSFSAPLLIYQHGVEQGAKAFQAKPLILGEVVPGSLRKEADGWHIRYVLNKAIKQAKDVIQAAYKGLVAVSSDSITHLARLDIGGKLQMYDKSKPGRIAVWPLAGVSVWELGNGNLRPANRTAYALPAMKAIYREAGMPFPDLSGVIDGGSPDADELAAKRARNAGIKAETEKHIKRITKILGD